MLERNVLPILLYFENMHAFIIIVKLFLAEKKRERKEKVSFQIRNC